MHFKKNMDDDAANTAKREEAARQLPQHIAEMKRANSERAKVATIVAGDFNTDPTRRRIRSGTNLRDLEGEICLALGEHSGSRTGD